MAFGNGTLDQRNPQVTLQPEEELQLTKFLVDEKLLLPILTNLLENASKYSPQGSTVDLALECRWWQKVYLHNCDAPKSILINFQGRH
jgi:K+-sensing histidine kinase KdpD